MEFRETARILDADDMERLGALTSAGFAYFLAETPPERIEPVSTSTRPTISGS